MTAGDFCLIFRFAAAFVCKFCAERPLVHCMFLRAVLKAPHIETGLNVRRAPVRCVHVLAEMFIQDIDKLDDL